jgi:hypothetical protein
MSYTGLTEIQLDDHEELSAVVMLLCSDLYDNRLMTLPDSATNQLAESILDQHVTA